MANMRPSWPPPITPIVAPGSNVFPLGHGNFCAENVFRLASPKLLHRRANLGVMQSDDTGGKESGVFRSRDSDGERSDRDSGRHLRNRKQRVESLQCARLDRHAEHRQPGLRGNHPGQMGRAARARDDHLHPALGGFARELRHQVRRSMRGDDPMLVRHAELIEQRHAMLHRFPIRGAPHHDTDKSGSGHFFRHKARSPSLLPKRKNCNALFGAAIILGKAEESLAGTERACRKNHTGAPRLCLLNEAETI